MYTTKRSHVGYIWEELGEDWWVNIIKNVCVLVSFRQLDASLRSSGKDHQLRNCLHQNGLWASCEDIFLIDDWCGKDQSTVGGAHAWAECPGCYKKEGWTSHGNKQSAVFLHGLCFQVPACVPVLTYHDDVLWYGSESQINPFFPKLILPVFIIAIEIKLEHYAHMTVSRGESIKNSISKLK